MRKLLLHNIFYLYAINIFVLTTTAICYAQETDNNSRINVEREILEQLNILKKNNIDNNKNEVSIKVEPTKVQPQKEVIQNKKAEITKSPIIPATATSTPSSNNKENNITNNKINSFPQKDAIVVKKADAITPKDGVTSCTCIRENKQLEIANQKINELARELENKKRQLILVETEVERLSEVIEKRNRAKLNSTQQNSVPQNVQPQQIQALQKQMINIRKAYQDLESERADLPIVIVTVNKANLRAGPSLKDSPILEVSKGTRLVVETRQENWYRVMAPNGKRAWVSSDVVSFGPTTNSRPSATTRIRGYNQNVEDKTESILR